ncbi:BAG domain-containing protein Samui [Frankliniella fusca]|uniref:BAG domain-containing protein Samui n=1 Tax=Frankliniella fusca TaxID=407009 RepID=A0AAE1I059_9NEOP|nr:BAG domain-containing protein Samui [Frankliniella fusca]
MSFGFRDKDRPSLRDRFRGKSGDQIVEELRKKLDSDREMFFERVPNPSSFRRAGFPFDDDGLRARGRPDFRNRLEELAQQHPEFADSLRPWYDQQQQPPPPQQQQQPQQDMGWGFRQRTGSNSSQQPQAQQEPQQEQPQQQQEPPQQQPGLAHHGLRNTVDIGEAQAQMDGQAQHDERVKRAQSAPPAPDQAGPGAGEHTPSQGQRFVSRLDINPQPGSTDPAAAKPPPGPKQQQQQPPQPAKTASGNVRQIPIFVEGRDEPVLAKDDVDSATNFGQSFPERPGGTRPNFGQSFPERPGGTRPSFGQGFSRSNMGFPSFHSRESCDQEAPAHKRPFPPQQQHPQAAPQRQPHHQQPHQPHYQQPHLPHYQQQAHHQQPHQQQPPRQHTPPQAQQQAPPPQAQPQQAPPPPPQQQKQPKDPLEKVKEVQLEVESLAKQVDEFKGTRKDKQYLYLDEMLTRELIKLDVIETEGRDEVRAARKEAIRSIQQCISRLESKADSEQAAAAPAPATTESMEVDPASAAPSTESMEVDPSSSQTSGDCKTEAQEAAAPAPPAEPAQPAEAAAGAPPVSMDTTPAAAAPAPPAAAPESVQTPATTTSPAQDSATPAEVPPSS